MHTAHSDPWALLLSLLAYYGRMVVTVSHVAFILVSFYESLYV